MAEKTDGAMNGSGIVDLGFPMWPQFNPKTFDQVTETLKSGKVSYWTGKKGMEFEEKWAKWIGSDYAISCTNGTAALHIAIAALNIGPGDEFCDVTDDHTIDPDLIEGLITPRTKGIVVVHLYGVMCDMKKIMAIAKKHNLKVIEDCAQCFGGVYTDENGVEHKSGTVGDVGCFSFCQCILNCRHDTLFSFILNFLNVLIL